MLTVRDVYILAASLIGDHENDDYDERDFSIQYMNILLQEALGAENSIRSCHGEPLLGAAPLVEDLENGLVYHDSLVRGAFPYGLAWQYHQEAGNLSLAAQYRNMFIDGVNNATMFTVVRK